MEDWNVHFTYTVNDSGTDLWEEDKDGPVVSLRDIEAGSWGWPGAAQLLQVFSAVEKAEECRSLVDADLTCAVSAFRSDYDGTGDSEGLIEEADIFAWSLKRVEGGGLEFAAAGGITHAESGDWPSHGVIKDGQLT